MLHLAVGNVGRVADDASNLALQFLDRAVPLPYSQLHFQRSSDLSGQVQIFMAYLVQAALNANLSGAYDRMHAPAAHLCRTCSAGLKRCCF